MDRPLNEYYINCAKNIYHANFDLLSMTKIAGFNFRHNDRNFPLLYALSRGARYIEIDVWVWHAHLHKIRILDYYQFS